MKINLPPLALAALATLAAPTLAENHTTAPREQAQHARARVDESATYTLSNDLLTWSSSAKSPAVFTLQQKGRAATQSSQTPFSITTSEGTYSAESFTISDVRLSRLKPADVSIDPSHQRHGQSITATFQNEAAGIVIKWSAELRDGTHHVKQSYMIYATRTIEITHIDLMKLSGTGFQMPDSTKHSPLTHSASRTFYAIYPSAGLAKISDEGAEFGFDCQLPMKKNQCYSFSSLQGIYTGEELGRDWEKIFVQ